MRTESAVRGRLVRLLSVPVCAVIAAALAPGAAPAGARSEGPAAIASAPVRARHTPGDFNGDGAADLAIGVPGEAVLGLAGAGAVNVIYGSGRGLSSQGDQFLHLGRDGLQGSPAPGDRFGAALALGDFDGDGKGDLAVGAPGRDVGGASEAGAVGVLYGSDQGLSSQGDQLWTQDSPGVPGSAAPGDSFGFSLGAGDLNGDGFADLAIGVPGETVNGHGNAGGVDVLYGSRRGLTENGSQLWTQDTEGIINAAETGDVFGYALTIGDFDGDGRRDLAVGVPLEDPPTDSGAVNVIYGSAGGLTAAGNQIWSQNSTGVADTGENQDLFGYALSSGDFDGDGRVDLAIGVPGEDVNGRSDTGAVNVLYGSGAGLAPAGNQFWNQDAPGILNAAEPGDEFGLSLAAGDFDGNGRADLAIGVPFEDPPTDCGAVNVIYGASGGLAAAGNQIWSEDSAGSAGAAQEDDFGASLAGGDFDRDGRADLAVGAPQKSVDGSSSAGAVSVIYGSPSRLSSAGSQLWTQDTPAIANNAEVGDFFGQSLGAARSHSSGRSSGPPHLGS